MKYILLLFILFSGGFVFHSCATENVPLKMGIISDPHYLSEQLMDGGEAILNYDKMSGKTVSEVPAILDQVINDYLDSDIEILLVAGDMTKDGEEQSHIDFVKKLRPLMDKGIKIFVIPGNHDINMPNSIGYEGNSTYKVKNVNPEEFAVIYADLGYKSALRRDANSLSYVSELNKDTWLLAIDSNRYKEYTDKTVSGGKISPETEGWIKLVLNDATAKNIQVVGLMHHGLVEHIMMQSSFFSDYLVEDRIRLANLFADNGMKIIFTGHFHSNDITEFTSQQNNKIYDIETGSLSAYAFPYRFAQLDKNKIKIETKNIITTPFHPQLAQDNRKVMEDRARAIALAKFKQKGYNFPDKTAELMADVIAKVFVEHLKGDEEIDDALMQSLKQLSEELDSPLEMPGQMSAIDFYPADNNVEISF